MREVASLINRGASSRQAKFELGMSQTVRVAGCAPTKNGDNPLTPPPFAKSSQQYKERYRHKYVGKILARVMVGRYIRNIRTISCFLLAQLTKRTFALNFNAPGRLAQLCCVTKKYEI